MKRKVIRLNENDIENLVKKIIKENTINEVGGYDSGEIANSHSESTMWDIKETYEVMADALDHISELKLDIVDTNLSRATRQFVNSIQPIMNRYAQAWTDAEKRRVG